jgi:histidyl-tRNA synthetase
MATINTAPLSGMRDFLPLDVLRRRYVVDVIERVYQRYGFEPLETPAMERLDTLLGKYGEEGDQLIFRVLKRGDALQRALGEDPAQNTLSDGGLRYDLTVPLARVMAAYRQHLPRVFKRYQIQPVYRADRPARGRYREFYQCDVDIVGSKSYVAEIEVIGAVTEVLLELGFTAPGDFAVRLNHRGVLRGLMRSVGIPEDRETDTLIAIDKLDKIQLEGVRAELLSRGVDVAAVSALLDLLADTPEDNEVRLDWLASVMAEDEPARSAVADLRAVLHGARATIAAGRIRLDPYLARGLSYYTGPIFEIAFPQLGVSAGGGGRYDGLVGMFSGRQIPACGFSLGLERLLLVLDERALFPERLAGQPQVLVTLAGPDQLAASLQLAQDLRRSGLRTDLYTEFDRYGSQFQYAEKRGIRFALLLGSRETATGVVAVRDLVTGQQEDIPVAVVGAWLQERVEPASTA